jgi:hypothetical protein
VAALVVAGLVAVSARLAPIYVRNMKFQSFVTQIAHNGATQSDDALRAQVLDKAHDLALPVREGDVRVERTDGSTRIDVRYFVRVDLPGYTVDLHFHPATANP